MQRCKPRLYVVLSVSHCGWHERETDVLWCFQLELQQKHDALASKNAQLEAQNLKLATLLEQQTLITDELRVQLQGVSKYGDNNVSDSDPSSECAADLMFASSSSSTSSSLLECPHSVDHPLYM